jgi:hypothetical protein
MWLRPPTVRELGRVSRNRWKELRQRLDQRRQARISARGPAAIRRPISPGWSSRHAKQLCQLRESGVETYRARQASSLIGSGDPPHCHPSRPATHPARPHHCMAMLATRTSGRRTTHAPEAKTAIAILACRAGAQVSRESERLAKALNRAGACPSRVALGRRYDIRRPSHRASKTVKERGGWPAAGTGHREELP